MTQLGRALFSDTTLSASGAVSCASCHDPSRAYGPANARAVQLAGAAGRSEGRRAAPSIRYVQNVPSFTEHFHEGEDDSLDQGPTGGHTWDGRAATVHEQAQLPLLSAEEMGNASAAAVVDELKAGRHAGDFRKLFGADIFDRPQRAFDALLLVLEVFQQSPADFYPYSSRYDGWLRGTVRLSAEEERGRRLFNDPGKGNCALCHPSTIKEGSFPQFTDWGFIALGVPRNRALKVNRPADYFDLGLCGPLRADFAGRGDYCGLFRTPSLRNVARRSAFFHNGVLHRLEDVVAFYAERDSNPARWYPRDRAGRVDKFDDLPPAYRSNVNREPPFGAKAGGAPALDRAEIADIVAFLKTLDDAPVSPAR